MLSLSKQRLESNLRRQVSQLLLRLSVAGAATHLQDLLAPSDLVNLALSPKPCYNVGALSTFPDTQQLRKVGIPHFSSL